MREKQGCSQYHFSQQDKFCQRKYKHIFYALSGNVCHSYDNKTATGQNQYCKIGTTIYAVNFGGNSHTDDRGIIHNKLNRSDWQVQPNLWVTNQSRFIVTDVPKQDIPIYRNWVSGAFYRLNKTRSVELGCAVLTFQTYGDGYYEISMKTGELYHNARQNLNRTMSVILNNMYIVKEFVIERYRKSPNGLELVANFRITQNNKLLELQGHPSKTVNLNSNKLQLEFCHSNCDLTSMGITVDRSWVMYGLSIVKFDV